MIIIELEYLLETLKLLVLDRNTRTHKTVCKLFVSDVNVILL